MNSTDFIVLLIGTGVIATLAFIIGRALPRKAPVVPPQPDGLFDRVKPADLKTIIDASVQMAFANHVPAPVEGPKVVVNMPADFKPMVGLPASEVEGARAVLYWTIFSCARNAIEDSSGYLSSSEIDSCTEAAQAAVASVFGPPKLG